MNDERGTMNDEQGTMRRGLVRFGPWLVIGGLVLLFFNKMVFSNLILARGDTFLYFYPYWQAAAEALGNGRLPLWNPALFMGAPLLANSQVGFFYPLNWPVWLLLPTPYAVSAAIVLHLVIAGWGAYLVGRRALAWACGRLCSRPFSSPSAAISPPRWSTSIRCRGWPGCPGFWWRWVTAVCGIGASG